MQTEDYRRVLLLICPLKDVTSLGYIIGKQYGLKREDQGDVRRDSR